MFAASEGKTHDGESWRRVGHPGALPDETRPLPGEGSQPRKHPTPSQQQ